MMRKHRAPKSGHDRSETNLSIKQYGNLNPQIRMPRSSAARNSKPLNTKKPIFPEVLSLNLSICLKSFGCSNASLQLLPEAGAQRTL